LGRTPESRLDELAALQEPGNHPVDVPIMCSITRFGLRNARSLASSYLDFRRLLRAVEEWRSVTRVEELVDLHWLDR
jgi:hypothetical protein